MIKIPITNELSTNISEILGVLETSEDFANVLARMLVEGICVKLVGIVSKIGEDYKLRIASFVAASGAESTGPKRFYGVHLLSAQGMNIRRVAGFTEWQHAADFGEKQVTDKKCSGFRIFNASEFVENSSWTP